MATAENVAAERRVEWLEADLIGQQLVHVRTTFVICARDGCIVRGESVPEPDYATAAEVLEAAAHEPAVREIRREPDLELLIDPLTQARVLRSALLEADRVEFDELAAADGVRLVEVEIWCHEGQLAAIRSPAPLVAAFGGNRAGKSMILVWRLFRRWMLRGGQPGPDGKPRVFWWVGPDLTKIIEEGLWAIAGPNGEGGGVWPDALFRGLKPVPRSAKSPQLTMLDGSVIAFKHASHRGASAGKNLKSAKVVDAVVDEVGAIGAEANFHQVQIRVSQSGGSVGASTTRVVNHWSHERITLRAKQQGPEVIDVHQFDLYDNPWMTLARIWQLFLTDKTLTTNQLETQVLPAAAGGDVAEKRAAALAVITSPESMREHFGIETHTGLLMWSEWRPELVYHSSKHQHAEIHVERDDSGIKRRVRLINITAAVLAGMLPRQTEKGITFDRWAGCDFNVRGHAAIFEVFGEGRTVEEAMANRSSWTVLVVDEVQINGTTERMADAIIELAGPIPVLYDPHGAPGHASRGSATSSDAQVLRAKGLIAMPANGFNEEGKPKGLAQLDSRDVMHALMRYTRYLVHARCTGTIESMNRDERKPDGRLKKTPGGASDFMSGYSDSVRYGLWRPFQFILREIQKDNA